MGSAELKNILKANVSSPNVTYAVFLGKSKCAWRESLFCFNLYTQACLYCITSRIDFVLIIYRARMYKT